MPKIIEKYKLKDYKYFNKETFQNLYNYKYIIINAKEKGKNKNLENEFIEIFEKYKENEFSKVQIEEFDIQKYGIDLFYFYTNELIINFFNTNFSKESYKLIFNFYKNVCHPLFDREIISAIQLFYDPETFKNIVTNYKLKEKNKNTIMMIILCSYRYFLNEIYSDKHGFFFSFYKGLKIDDNYYPGNDVRNNISYYKLYSKIKKNYSYLNNNDKGLYFCLCRESYNDCQCILKSNFLKNKVKCKYCQKPPTIENAKKKFILIVNKKIVNIFSGKNIYLTNNWERFSITLEEFKEKYINRYFIEEKGVTTNTNSNHLKKDDKIIRNLSQVTYRLLNYILYSHIFFARIFTNKKEFDKYLPNDMNWNNILNECWELLKIELEKKEVSDIVVFMNYIFHDLFIILNETNEIKNFDVLLKVEQKLDQLILNKINDFKKELDQVENMKKKKVYNNSDGKSEQFYNLFLYSNYINEAYLNDKLSHIEDGKYPVLRRYLMNKNDHKYNKKTLNLDYLIIFNKVLNLIKDEYIFKITRTKAENTILKDEEIYKLNKDDFDEFIKLFNFLNNNNDKIIELTNESKLSNFFIDEENEYGKLYKIIYKEFILMQNEEIEELLNLKIEEKIFDGDCLKKINIQNVQEDEIFLPKLEISSFFNIVFNCSYRKVALNDDFNDCEQQYDNYVINYDLIEEKMTERFLRNKKLFNDIINDFIYKYDLILEDNDIIQRFNEIYSTQQLFITEKIYLYNFYLNNKENINMLKNIINDFKIILIHLISLKENDDNVKITDIENKKISEIMKNITKEIISDDFSNLIKSSEFLVGKLANMFEYYLMTIFPTLIGEISLYQIELENEKKKIN